MTEKMEKEECVKCGASVKVESDADKRKPCPECGSMGRKRDAVFNEKLTIKQSGKTIHEGKRTKITYPLLIISIIIGVVGGFSGFLAVGEMGVVIGIVLSLVSLYVGKDSFINEKFRNTERF